MRKLLWLVIPSSWLVLLMPALAVLLLLPLDPDVTVGDFIPTEYKGKLNLSPYYHVEDHYFKSKDTVNSCHAWLYLPKNNNKNKKAAEHSSSIQDEENGDGNEPPLPVILMANGFAEQKDWGLDVYAEQFVARGFAVLLFDYRSFGASQGYPRNLVSPKKHVQDWNSAIDHIAITNGLGGLVNPQKIGLWGVSFAGGHVLTVASQRRNDTNIVGIVAQTPYLKSSASTKKSGKKRGKIGKLRLVLAALQDSARGYLGLEPVVIPIIGIAGQLAMLQSTPERLEAYLALQPAEKLGGWINQGPVRGLFELKSYNPLETVRQAPPSIPVLLVGGSRDALCPVKIIEEAHKLLPQSRVIIRDASHQEIIGPDHAPEVGKEMASFYQECFQ